MQSVEMIPFGLLAGFVDDKEVRITEISTESFCFRVRASVERPRHIRIRFYDFSESTYREVRIENYHFREEKQERWYVSYTVEVAQKDYVQAVQKLFREYTGYIRARLEGTDGEMAQIACNYPADQDEIHAESMEEQKAIWFSGARIQPVVQGMELALELDRNTWYDLYQRNPIERFAEQYWKENGIDGWEEYKTIPDRLYIGNAFCHLLFPKEEQLFTLMEKAIVENVEITLVFACMREFQVEERGKLLKKVDNWCEKRQTRVEILVNDWGMTALVKESGKHLEPCLGVLLNKQKKDPRMRYKKGSTSGLGESNLQADFYRTFLKDTYGITRYEWESCGYPQVFPQGKNSLHLPYYQTNTSQYCPLYASCTESERGKQRLPEHCPGYCEQYAYLYPEHLHMAGRYNSLFGLDAELVKHPEKLKAYQQAGIDRLVIGL